MRNILIGLIVLSALAVAWADTGLGTSPFTTRGKMTAAQANAINDAINALYALEGLIECDGTNCTVKAIGTDIEAKVTEGSLTDGVIVSADIKDGDIAAGDLNDTQDWSGKDITLAPYPTLTLELDDLSDSTSPYNMTENEVRGFIISNQRDTPADAVLDFENIPLAEGRDFCVVIEAAYQITIEPDTDENWYLNGTQCGANDAIFNDDDTVGEMLCCISTERNMFCVSQDANWECE
jgi:hypothetical protein